MAPLIQSKTLKQIRDRRRNAAYQDSREKYLKRKGIDNPSGNNADNESTSRSSVDASRTSDSSVQR
nr:unnamed protein product [Callosobruchus analis]